MPDNDYSLEARARRYVENDDDAPPDMLEEFLEDLGTARRGMADWQAAANQAIQERDEARAMLAMAERDAQWATQAIDRIRAAHKRGYDEGFPTAMSQIREILGEREPS